MHTIMHCEIRAYKNSIVILIVIVGGGRSVYKDEVFNHCNSFQRHYIVCNAISAYKFTSNEPFSLSCTIPYIMFTDEDEYII